jgi:phage shock protein A
VSQEASEAKTNLVRFREEIRSLEREKVRILATLANARARRRIQEAFEGLSVDADMRALESVREYVARVSTEGRLGQELEEDGDLRRRVKAIRHEAETEAQRAELDELKRRLRPTLPLPIAAV